MSTEVIYINLIFSRLTKMSYYNSMLQTKIKEGKMANKNVTGFERDVAQKSSVQNRPSPQQMAEACKSVIGWDYFTMF